MVVTQVSVGGFDNYVTAKMLLDYFEDNIGVVWRCRLKTSSTPPESYPNFEIDAADVKRMNDYEKVEPHAFVHFASPSSAKSALDAAGRAELMLINNPLKVSLGPENPYSMNQRRRTKVPFTLSGVCMEIGLLVTRDEFFVGWRGPPAGVDFLVDPFDGTCKFLFTKDVAFSLKGTSRHVDFTPSGAIGRCNTYRISIPPRKGPSLTKAMAYLREQRVPDDCPKKQLRIRDEPDFGMPMSDPFFCIQYKEGITFKIMFLVNAVMHKGIINQHQLSDGFFDLLRRQPEVVNAAALQHLSSYRRPVFDACKRLKLVQEWLLKNPTLLQRPRELDDIVEVRRLVITPTKAYCLPPEVELSNRVLRNYREVADRFLRVTFMDEAMQTLNKNVLSYYSASIVRDIRSNSSNQKTTMFKRVKNILSEGFYLCGRKYFFLAFSANQLRDRSAWFFAEDKRISVGNIISWMGRFKNRNVAKCAARMGQCFSSTYATVEVPPNEVDSKLPDIKRNGYDFSDGIGMITPDLAMEVAEKLQLRVNPPVCISDQICWLQRGCCLLASKK
ncbi:hypothetical protein F0562_012239 [Nyssa sinensis]|uniref:RNA-dependent RNA polymerase n=1 Tax=Nyssa sinensis TaxID=561372 RepID=A0A5J4ZUM7_9ASTE|nr:hypothetical protein F0562_012239 [Nyssa sinensis]